MDSDSGLGLVDGTLRNPLVAAVVLVWALVLFAACWGALKSGSRFRGVVVAAVLLAGCVASPVIALIVGGIYRVTSSMSAGLVGRPPAWVASLAAAVALLIAGVRERGARERRARTGDRGGPPDSGR